MFVSDNNKARSKQPVTLALLSLLLALAGLLRKVDLVVSIAGSICGPALIFLIPSYMKNKLLKSNRAIDRSSNSAISEYSRNVLTMVTGVVVGLVGVGLIVLR